MKTILVFFALLIGTVLNAKDIASKDTVNGWYFWKAIGNDVDTAYTHLTTKSYEGKSAQIFGNSTKNNRDLIGWRMDLNKSYLFPKFVIAKVALDSIGTDSAGSASIGFFVGNKKNPDVIYRMSGSGADGYFLQHPEWFSRPYWFDAGSRINGPFAKPDSIDFIIVLIRYSSDNKDPKCEYIVDKLCFAYGEGNPWEDPTADSSIVIDRFGDPDPAPIFKIDKKYLDFGVIGPNSTKTENINISNSGDAPLVISRVWTNNPSFSAKYEKSIVKIGSSVNLAIKFNQDSVRGLKKGLIFIEHKGANVREIAPDWSNSLVVYLVDTTTRIDTVWLTADFKGPEPKPAMLSIKSSVDFGNIQINAVSYKETTLVFRNLGDSVLNGKISIKGGGFSIVGDSAFAIQPMDSVSKTLRFYPTKIGKTTGLLVIKSNNSTSPDTVLLTAMVVGAIPNVRPSKIAMGNVPIGTSKNDTVYIENNGNIVLHIDSVKSMNPKFVVTPGKDSIPADGKKMFIIKFQSNTLGSESDTIFFFNNSSISPLVVTITAKVVTGIKEDGILPTEFSLSQNYPNPFNPSTTIEFSLPKRASVNLTIYNTLGQEVKTLINRELNEGIHRINWNAEVPSGTYFYRLNAGNFVAAKKMTLMR